MSRYVYKASADEFAPIQRSAGGLTELVFELTERCNNNCRHCYINRPENDANALASEQSTDTIKALLHEAADLGCMTVRLTGGEPLLRPDFSDIYLHARRLGLRVTVFTNGCLINEELARLWSRIPPLDKIEVSLYGMKTETYEAVTRTPGSFKAAWTGVELLRRYKIPFVIKSALMPANRSDYDELNKFSAMASGEPGPPRYALFYDLRTRRDSGLRNATIRQQRFSAAAGMAVLQENRIKYREESLQFCRQFLNPHGDRLFVCGAGVDRCCVDAYGRLQMCTLLRHPDTVYDLKQGSLKQGLSGFFHEKRKQISFNRVYLQRCGRCFLKGLCEQCPAKSWSEHGTLDSPVEYLCNIAHEEAVQLGLLLREEKAWLVDNWRERLAEAVSASSAFERINGKDG